MLIAIRCHSSGNNLTDVDQNQSFSLQRLKVESSLLAAQQSAAPASSKELISCDGLIGWLAQLDIFWQTLLLQFQLWTSQLNC